MKRFFILLGVLLFAFTGMCFASGHFIYIIRDEGVYVGGYGIGGKVEEVDLDSFELVGAQPSMYGDMHRFAKDKNHVYDYGKIVVGVSPVGFDVVSGWDLVKNKDFVYRTEPPAKWGVLEAADPVTFQRVSTELYKDKKRVYFRYAPNRELYPVPGANPATFQILGTKYAKDDKTVFYLLKEDWKERFIPIERAHAQSFVFTSMDSPFSQDHQSIFYEGKRIADSDSQSFTQINEVYSKDKKQVYYRNHILPLANPQTFRLIHTEYGMDDRNVYYHEMQIVEADAGSFRLIGGGYAKDDNAIYYKGKRLAEADPASFEVTYRYYEEAEDKNHKYRKGEITTTERPEIASVVYQGKVYWKWGGNQSNEIDQADPVSFVQLGGFFGKDKKKAFYFGYAIEPADVQSFKVLDENGFAKDKNRVYYEKDILTADPKSFKALNFEYGKDGHRVFAKKEQVKDADAATFELVYGRYGKDKRHVYFEGKVLPLADPLTFDPLKNTHDWYTKDANHVILKIRC